MKKLIIRIAFLPFFLVFQGYVFAQNQIPNNDFEYWETIGSYEEPVDWNTPNPYTAS